MLGESRRRGSRRRESAEVQRQEPPCPRGRERVYYVLPRVFVGGRLCLHVCVSVYKCVRVSVYSRACLSAHACGRTHVDANVFVRQVRTRRLIRSPPPTDTGPQ